MKSVAVRLAVALSRPERLRFMIEKVFFGAWVRVTKLLIAAATAFLTTAGASYATTVTITGDYSIALSGFDGNKPTITKKLKDPFKEVLTIGTSTAELNFFTASPSSSCGTGCTIGPNEGTTKHPHYYYTDTGTITVTFNINLPTGITDTFTETGIYQAKYGGAPLSCTSSSAGDTDCIDWTSTNPVPIIFATADPKIDDVLYITLYNAQDWAITPKISFDVLQIPVGGQQSTTPIPAALPLFASGLGALGLLGWRRKRKASAAIAT